MQETLPSGNRLFFSYDSAGHLQRIELKSSSLTKTISWLDFTYSFSQAGATVSIATSDEKWLEYRFALLHLLDGSSSYCLIAVTGSHVTPCHYDYSCQGTLCQLIKSCFPAGRFQGVDYDAEGRVQALLHPDALSGEPIAAYTFFYEGEATTVLDGSGVRSRYLKDEL